MSFGPPAWTDCFYACKVASPLNNRLNFSKNIISLTISFITMTFKCSISYEAPNIGVLDNVSVNIRSLYGLNTTSRLYFCRLIIRRWSLPEATCRSFLKIKADEEYTLFFSVQVWSLNFCKTDVRASIFFLIWVVGVELPKKKRFSGLEKGCTEYELTASTLYAYRQFGIQESK